MKTFTLVMLSTAALGLSNPVTANTELEIEWFEPEKFTDVRPTNESRKSFRTNTFKHLESYFHELSSELADNQKLIIKVTNLDLAGNVWPASFVGLGPSGSDVRVIKNTDIPRINFNYQLIDGTGGIIKQAEVKLKNMMFLDSSIGFFKSDPLRYEKSMLKRWFDQEFESQPKIQS